MERPGTRNPIALAFDSEILSLRAVRGGVSTTLDTGDREAILAEVRAGTYTGKLEVEAITYLQIEGKRNRNFTRFKQNRLGKIAKTGRGSVFLADHAQRDLASRGGTIVASEAVEHKGGLAFRQTIELTKPWAIEGVLDGTIDRFSIGWLATGPVLCTACDADWLECAHWPGDEVIRDDGSSVIVEFEFTDAELVETSAVNVPAVVGTRIEGIRTALAVVRAQRGRDTRGRENAMHRKLATALGLADDADHESVLAAIDKIRATAEEATTMLAAEKETHAATRKALEEARSEVAALTANQHEATVSELIEGAIRDGKIVPATVVGPDGKPKRTESAVEKAIRLMARASLDGAREYVNGLPRIVPLGATGGLPAPRRGGPVLDDEQRRINKQLGIDDETWLRHNPPDAGAAR